MIRIGVLVPSSNTVLEPELARLADGVCLHFSRVRVTRIGVDADAAAQFDTAAMVGAAELLADAGVDVIVWGGTAGSWLGVPHDLSIVSAIEAATGVPATTSTLALLEAARAFGLSRTALVTPYVAEVVSEIVSCYAESGLEVSGGEHLGLSDNHSFGLVAAGTLQPMIASADAPVMVVCTNLRAARVVDLVEASGGPLVLDSVVATLWGALRLAGVPVSLPGGGALLRSGALRADLQSLCAWLLSETAADRITVRLDVPEQGLHVDLAAAEAVGPGMRRIAGDPSLDQRALNTVRWLETHRRLLVQPRFGPDPRPPAALIEMYGVNAQMLGPVSCGSEMAGWVSVHSGVERTWSAADQEALSLASAQVSELLKSYQGS
ncbi:hypothetical protein [Actinacidiphila oryziradicis]|uniref:maleate cis-trans isomerase family protein n=1 Tax=Actinacidiphila oryziradicis TaxID=2571141 RepID=UPI0023EFB322|nr:hypothetical protein [Actinacidiphila oryziradicis]